MIYFIQAGDDGPIKIGYSKTKAGCEERRLRFQTGHHTKLRIIAVIDGERAAETSFHRKFAAHRLEGEWFEPMPAVLNAAGLGPWAGYRWLADQLREVITREAYREVRAQIETRALPHRLTNDPEQLAHALGVESQPWFEADMSCAAEGVAA